MRQRQADRIKCDYFFDFIVNVRINKYTYIRNLKSVMFHISFVFKNVIS